MGAAAEAAVKVAVADADAADATVVLDAAVADATLFCEAVEVAVRVRLFFTPEARGAEFGGAKKRIRLEANVNALCCSNRRRSTTYHWLRDDTKTLVVLRFAARAALSCPATYVS